MIGKLIGAIAFGAISDAFGRFRTYFIALVLQFVCAVIIAIDAVFRNHGTLAP